MELDLRWPPPAVKGNPDFVVHSSSSFLLVPWPQLKTDENDDGCA